MFGDTSMLQEFAPDAERYFPAFRPAQRWIIAGVTFLLIGSSALSAENTWQLKIGTRIWATPGNWSLGIPANDTVAVVGNGPSYYSANQAAGAKADTLTVDGDTRSSCMAVILAPPPFTKNHDWTAREVRVQRGRCLRNWNRFERRRNAGDIDRW
jgi:hypothetical protein